MTVQMDSFEDVAFRRRDSGLADVGEVPGFESTLRDVRIKVRTRARRRNVWEPPQHLRWLTEVAARLEDVLGPVTGREAVTREALLAALSVLRQTMSRDSIAPQVVPTRDGGLQLEWHRAGVDLEVYIQPQGSVSAWCREGVREWDDEPYSPAKLSKELSILRYAPSE
jgi:hypothetical protein